MFEGYKFILIDHPPETGKWFSMLTACGATHFALFGGAVRDTDYAAVHGKTVPINDYDIRIWLPYGENSSGLNRFVALLEKLTNATSNIVPGRGSSRPRYILHINDITLDLSFGDVSAEHLASLPVQSVAINCIFKSNIGLSAVAIDSSGQAWARPEYGTDRDGFKLTVYPDDNEDRRTMYLAKMQQKYPDHCIEMPGNCAPAPDYFTA